MLAFSLKQIFSLFPLRYAFLFFFISFSTTTKITFASTSNSDKRQRFDSCALEYIYKNHFNIVSHKWCVLNSQLQWSKWSRCLSVVVLVELILTHTHTHLCTMRHKKIQFISFVENDDTFLPYGYSGITFSAHQMTKWFHFSYFWFGAMKATTRLSLVLFFFCFWIWL